MLLQLGEGPPGGLSEREDEQLVLAARGLFNARIAGELRISKATVKRHMANIYQKIGGNSRPQALVFAPRHGAVRIGGGQSTAG